MYGDEASQKTQVQVHKVEMRQGEERRPEIRMNFGNRRIWIDLLRYPDDFFCFFSFYFLSS